MFIEMRSPWGVYTKGMAKREGLPSLPQHLAAQQTYNHLDMSVGEALRQRTLCLEGVLSCQPDESLGEVIERIAKEQVRSAHLLYNQAPSPPPPSSHFSAS